MMVTEAELRQKMTNNRAGFAKQVAAIRGNAHLTFEGKSDALTRAYREAMRTHLALKRELRETVEKELDYLRARAFALPTATASETLGYRDALREAEAAAAAATAKPAALDALYQRARQTGDKLLAKAVALQLHKTGAFDTLAAVAEETRDPDLGALVDAERAFGAAMSADTKLARSAATTAPPLPAEVSPTAGNDLF